MTELDQARHALAEYHAEIAAGGEPVYPAWAVEIVKQYEGEKACN